MSVQAARRSAWLGSVDMCVFSLCVPTVLIEKGSQTGLGFGGGASEFLKAVAVGRFVSCTLRGRLECFGGHRPKVEVHLLVDPAHRALGLQYQLAIIDNAGSNIRVFGQDVKWMLVGVDRLIGKHAQ